MCFSHVQNKSINIGIRFYTLHTIFLPSYTEKVTKLQFLSATNLMGKV